ncbi:NGG1 interacting factor [Mactra antiquata]
MDLSSVVKRLHKLASPTLAGSWDNVGLLVEPSPPHQVETIFLTNDLTPPVLEEAIAKHSNMIISYHPPIFTGMKKLSQKQWKDRIIIKCIENRIALYSPHTSYDCVQGGVNDWLISCFDIKDVKPVELFETLPSCFSHLIQFTVNSDQSQILLKSLKDLQQVSVFDCIDRLDDLKQMSVSSVKSSIPQILSLLEQYSSVNNILTQQLTEVAKPGHGYGRKAKLTEKISLDKAVDLVKQHLKLDHVRLAATPDKKDISSVAVCAGSGGSVLRNVVADLYVTGEMSHHEVLHAVYNGTSVILCEHSNTERGYLDVLKTKLQDCLDDKTNIIVTEVDTDPLKVV